MTKKELQALTPEEVQALTGKDLEAYNKMILEGTTAPAKAPKSKKDADEEAPKTAEELAADYYAGNKEYQDGLLVTSDGVIYHDTPKGANHAYNYQRDKKAAGIEITISKHTK